MSNPLFDHAELRRIADALEGLLALARAHVTPAAPAAAPDPVPTPADAFAELTRNVPIGIALNDAEVGEEVLVKLTFAAPAAAPVPTPASDEFVDYCARFYPDAHALLVAPPAADPGDEDDSDDTGATYTRRIRWSKYDSRCRELARLRTAAKHRAAAAKTVDTKLNAMREQQQYHTRATTRHEVLRRWLAAGKIVIVDDALYMVNDDGTKSPWSADLLPSSAARN